ncbi:MAG: helix-turn-helix transcriptional regulator [Acutalibacteraceae bacterium]|nr:helix-turn-helix transcriptional regulator [Acutalibacteraceae bacterium]
MCKYRRLKELRIDNDKTQEEIAKIINTTFQYYSAYERGIRDITFSRAIQLAKFYNVSLDYIAELTDEKNTNWTIKNKNSNNKSVKIGNNNNNNEIKIKF